LIALPVKEKIDRGTKRRFEVYITDLDSNPQDPNECYVILVKQGSYSYDSPSPRYACKKTGTTGYWGADIRISTSMTLGDWNAEFEWYTPLEGWNGSKFPFTISDARRPYINRDPATIAPNVKVEE